MKAILCKEYGGSDVVDFFFSSRRRHTRWPRDWSSDVCSSDLQLLSAGILATAPDGHGSQFGVPVEGLTAPERSEERRVGKEWRSRRGGIRQQARRLQCSIRCSRRQGASCGAGHDTSRKDNMWI